jgi:hypothetical protein
MERDGYIYIYIYIYKQRKNNNNNNNNNNKNIKHRTSSVLRPLFPSVIPLLPSSPFITHPSPHPFCLKLSLKYRIRSFHVVIRLDNACALERAIRLGWEFKNF